MLRSKNKTKENSIKCVTFLRWVNEDFHPAKSGYLSSHHWSNMCKYNGEEGGGWWSRGAHFWSKFFSTYNRSRRKGASRQEKVTKNDITRRARSQKRDVPRTNFSMYFFVLLNIFLLHSHEALIILQRATRKHIQEPMTSIFPSTIIKWNKIDIKIQKLFRS